MSSLRFLVAYVNTNASVQPASGQRDGTESASSRANLSSNWAKAG